MTAAWGTRILHRPKVPAAINADSPAALLSLCPTYAPTPLLCLPSLAAALGVAAVLVKDEGRRPLGSFKALGGVYVGLRALARAAALPVGQSFPQRDEISGSFIALCIAAAAVTSQAELLFLLGCADLFSHGGLN